MQREETIILRMMLVWLWWSVSSTSTEHCRDEGRAECEKRKQGKEGKEMIIPVCSSH